MAAERTITATKLRRDLGAVLDAVLKGETIRVTRSGRPLAVLVPPDPPKPTQEGESSA